MHRKLAAILGADVVAYSKHMSLDEERTLAALHEVLGAFELFARQHGGRPFGRAGDSILAVFDSPVEAVRCAAELQRHLAQQRITPTAAGPLTLRMAVNLGDVIEDEGNVYGDGVNTAARLQGLAGAGGLVVSRSAYEHLQGKIDLRFAHMGAHKLHNLASRVHAYRADIGTGSRPGWLRTHRGYAAAAALLVAAVLAGGVFMAYPRPPATRLDTLQELAPELPAAPSIAVMPFANLSDNPEYLYLADGLTDDLITDLARISDLFVIAYNSVGNYRGREDAVRTAGRELGVRYVMQGSLRRLDQKLRVNVSLIDTLSGGHVWADRYDTGYEDLFDLEDDIVNSVARKLALKISASQQAGIDARETTSIAAYDAYRRGWANALRKTPDGLAEALKLFKQAVTIDPDYARAQAAIGLVYWNSWIWGWESSVGETWETAPARADEYAKKALRRPTATAYQLASQINLYARRYTEARRFAELALELDPKDPSSQVALAEVEIYTGEPERSLEPIRTSMRLDPLYPPYRQFVLGLAEFGLEHYDAAAELFQHALERNPEDYAPAAPLAALYVHLGQEEQAKAALATYLAGWSEANLEEFATYWPYERKVDLDRITGPLRMLGVPEKLP